MLFWCFSNESNETGFLSSWSWPCPKFQSPKRRRGRSQSKPIEEEAEANRSQSKKRPKRCVCCSPFTEKLASNFAVICEIDMWNRRQSPSSYAWLSEKGRQIPPPLLQSFYYIYYLQKWGLHNRSQIPSDSENRRQIGGYIIAPKSHLTAKTE